jgi:elongator complex protein 3
MYYPSTYPQKYDRLLKDLFLFLVDKNPKNRKDLMKLIRSFIADKKEKFFPKLWQLYFVYLRYFKNEIKVGENFLDLLKVVKIRSLSGIVPLSVFTSPKNSCPYNCVYCALNPDAPKSYFSDEAAVMRAKRANFDPFAQVKDRLIQFYLSGHPIDKVELIIQGGTFSFYDKKYRQWFVKRAFDSLNTDFEKLIIEGKTEFKEAKNLDEAKKANEKAKSRMVGLTVETRPDLINKDEILFLRYLGVTRVELGVQSVDNEILRIVRRGHTIDKVFEATKLLKDCGFKITYHLMPGLPGSNFEKDFEILRQVFEDERLKPDNIKFYPTQVVKNSPLADWYQKGIFKPIDEKYLLDLTLKFKKEIVKPWFRINRLVRDLTKNDLVIETFPSNFRQHLEKKLKEENIRCLCIRCREIRGKKIKLPVRLNAINYKASEGEEFFLEFVDNDYKLLGYLRLRIPSYVLKNESFFIKDLEGCALIRELHVLGSSTPLSKKGKVQHRGLGKKLINEAIKIAKKFNLSKIAVISAIGTREYYRRLGFKEMIEGEYLLKKF